MFRRLCSSSIALSVVCAPVYAAPVTPVETQLRSEVAAEIAGINAQDPVKATAYEADNMMFSECGKYATFGKPSYRQGLTATFKREAAWHLSLIDDEVAVAPAGNEAIYRSTYQEDSTRNGVPYTHNGNYVAGFQRDRDGIWRIHWSVVCWQSPSHKK